MGAHAQDKRNARNVPLEGDEIAQTRNRGPRSARMRAPQHVPTTAVPFSLSRPALPSRMRGGAFLLRRHFEAQPKPGRKPFCLQRRSAPRLNGSRTNRERKGIPSSLYPPCLPHYRHYFTTCSPIYILVLVQLLLFAPFFFLPLPGLTKCACRLRRRQATVKVPERTTQLLGCTSAYVPRYGLRPQYEYAGRLK